MQQKKLLIKIILHKPILLNHNKTMIFKLTNKLKTLVLLLLFSYNASAQNPAATVPDFTFFKLDKTAFTNKNLEQGKLLFFLFFDPTCEHCQRAIQSLNNHYKELKNAAVYLISSNDAETINQFINKYGKVLSNKKNVIQLQDHGGEFLSKFQPRKYPAMFLYSREKKLMRYEDNEDTMFRFYKEINTASK